jgi:hypothetical protein
MWLNSIEISMCQSVSSSSSSSSSSSNSNSRRRRRRKRRYSGDTYFFVDQVMIAWKVMSNTLQVNGMSLWHWSNSIFNDIICLLF